MSICPVCNKDGDIKKMVMLGHFISYSKFPDLVKTLPNTRNYSRIIFIDIHCWKMICDERSKEMTFGSMEWRRIG